MDSHSYEFQTNSGSDHQLHWIITLNPEYVWGGKEYHGERYET